MVKLEKIPESESLSISSLDGQSFTISKIEKSTYVDIHDTKPVVHITTKEKFRDVETNIQYNKFHTARMCVVAYLTKDNTLEELKKNKSIGPFGCKAYGGNFKSPPLYELHRAMTDRMGKVLLGDPVLTQNERTEIERKYANNPIIV